MSTLTVTLIQTRLHWEDKVRNLQMLEEKISSIGEKTELVLLPEMFSTGFSMKPEQLAETMEGETLRWMRRVAAERKIILAGSFICGEWNGPEMLFYNRLVWMLPNGRHGTYDKRHLFAFAGEDRHYTAGKKRLITSVKGWRIHTQICYDLRFPVWARQQATPEGPEYDVLIYVANWPERRNHAWKTLLQARAIENQCYVIGVNRVGDDGNGIYHSGDSMIVDPLGETMYHRAHDEDLFTCTLDREHLDSVRRKMPFWKDGDQFAIWQPEEADN